MSFLWVLTIIALIILAIGVVLAVKDVWGETAITVTVIFGFVFICLTIASIVQPISLKKEMIRQNKERQQILYQIGNLTETSDKVKLNEWILTYNDWVNDINTSKEFYGWFSWHYNFDMTNHTVINLV